jgi:predicted nucleotidyltransferase
MLLRSIPDNFSQAAVAAIDARLGDVCAQHDVRIPLAVESGSRAWGFASADSDYDCRFVFVRPVDQHLTPWPPRDVIETPLEGDLDINGWEFGKALKLMLKGNGTILEWLRSPIVYRGDAWFRDSLLALADRFVSRDLVGRHYLHIGERHQRQHFGDEQNVLQKKMFYVLRPVAVLRWLRLNPRQAVAPMHLPTLMKECDPPAVVAELVERLIAAKAVTSELRAAPLPRPVGEFIAEEFGIARNAFERGTRSDLSTEAKREAELLYREVTSRYEVRC